MKLLATADRHWFHDAVIGFCNRPFNSIEDMHKNMIKRWNFYVKPDDLVVDCGDLSFGTKEQTISILEQLNGKTILVLGNHDKWSKTFYLRHFYMVCNSFTFGNFIFTHEPLDTFHYKMVNVHGHVHNMIHRDEEFKNLPNSPRWINAGVDVNDFRPIPIWKGGS